MSLRYQYKLVLSLANRQVEIGEIKEEIKLSFKEFNIRSLVAKNPKEIVKYEISEKENLLYIWLNSNNKMAFPLRGLFVFSKIIIEQLDSGDKKKQNLLKSIIRNKCFFKLVEEPKETTNLKLEKTGENQSTNLIKSEKEIKEKDIQVDELEKRIIKLEGKIEKLEKVIKAIELEKREYLINLSEEESEWSKEMFCNDEDVDEENNEAFDKFDD